MVSWRHTSLVLVLFVVAFFLGDVLTPVKQEASFERFDFESKISVEFNEWKALPASGIKVIASDEQAFIDSLYSQTYEKSFENAKGQVVMLSIAYGATQTKDMLVHFPEVCYPAQGFEVISEGYNLLKRNDSGVTVKHLKTRNGQRFEDVSYWVRVGDTLVASRSSQKWESIKYGLQGVIPDGLLFRVSTINTEQSEELHSSFIFALIDSLDSETVKFLTANAFGAVK